MYDHKYDESGLTTSYVLLTGILPIFLYYCYKANRKPLEFNCIATNCNCYKSKNTKLFNYSVLSILTLIIAILVKCIHSLKFRNSVSRFNPFEVLGIDENTNIKIVKKKYRKMLRPLFQQAKAVGEKKSSAILEIESRIIVINKAFDLVKDPSNYEKWMYKQSKNELFVALPKTILEHPNALFSGYIGLASLLVVLFLRFWLGFKTKNVNSVYYETIEGFIDQIKSINGRDESISIREIIVLISRSRDFREHEFQINEEKIKGELGTVYGEPVIEKSASWFAIMDLLYRMNGNTVKDRIFIQEKAISILKGFQEISLVKRPDLYLTLCDIEKMFVQCIHSPRRGMLQYVNGTVNFSGGQSSVNTEGGIKSFLKEHPRALESALNIFCQIPRFSIKDLMAYSVDKTNKIYKDKCYLVSNEYNSYFSFKIIEEEAKNEASSKGKVEEGNEKNQAHSEKNKRVGRRKGSTIIHCPNLRIPNEHKIYYKINGIVQNDIISNFKLNREIRIPINNFSGGRCSIEVNVLNNGYFGFDVKEKIIAKNMKISLVNK